MAGESECEQAYVPFRSHSARLRALSILLLCLLLLLLLLILLLSVDHQPSADNYLILGDALLAIHEPQDAIMSFQAPEKCGLGILRYVRRGARWVPVDAVKRLILQSW